MTILYPEIEPYEHGLLDVSVGHNLYWEQCIQKGKRPSLFRLCAAKSV